MDHARRLGGGSTDLDCPGTYFLDPGSEVGLQVEQFVTGADHPVQTGLFHAHGLEEHELFLFVIQLGNLRLDLVAHRNHHGTFGGGDLVYHIQIGVVLEAFLGDVGDVHHRLAGQKMEAFDQLAFIVAQLLHQGACRLAFGKVGDELFQQRLLCHGFLVTALGGAGNPLQLLFAAFQVGEDQLQIDDLDIALGIDVVGHVDHVVVIEAAHHMGDGRSEEHTSELQSRPHLVCRLLLEKKKKNKNIYYAEKKKRYINDFYSTHTNLNF